MSAANEIQQKRWRPFIDHTLPCVALFCRLIATKQKLGIRFIASETAVCDTHVKLGHNSQIAAHHPWTCYLLEHWSVQVKKWQEFVFMVKLCAANLLCSSGVRSFYIISETAADVTHVVLVNRLTFAAKKPVIIHGRVTGCVSVILHFFPSFLQHL